MFRILVPLDGSALAAQALPVAGAIAKQRNGRIDLLLVHVLGPIATYAAMARVQEPRTIEEEYLARTADRLAHDSGVSVSYAVLPGNEVDIICSRARQLDANLIVMTTHGRTGFSRAWIGSVADAVVRESPVPVLLVRGSEKQPVPAQGAPRSFLIPLDGSKLAEQIIEPVLELVSDTDAKLTLVQVVMPIPQLAMNPMQPYAILSSAGVDQQVTDQAIRAAEEYLGALANRLRIRTAATMDHRAVLGDGIANEILQVAKELGVEAIAMTTRGRGATRLFVGSVADKLLRGATVPLLLYRPRVRRLSSGRKRARGKKAARI
ncbi:MAG TPA: universal stress protein [Gemmatimonadaceae bacterium]|nr:universal stress protein [Gemmatimonadaceae bacterium]